MLLLPAAVANGKSCYVAINGGHISPYTNWAMAATNIQAAVDVAQAGDRVVVSNGTYDTGGRVQYGNMTNRVVVNSDIVLESVNGARVTIIKGAGPPGVKAVRCLYVSEGAVVHGFTLAAGHTLTSGNWLFERSGGGAYVEQNALLENCMVRDCSADSLGGGVVGDGRVENCLIYNNKAGGSGGGARSVTLRQCTVVNNTAGDRGGGVNYLTLINSIVYYNKAYISDDNIRNCTAQYTCSDPRPSGTGNISDNPGIASFGNPALLNDAPCIDAGNFSQAAGLYDFERDPRIWGGGVDMGADEFYPPAITGAVAVGLQASSLRAVWNTPLQFICAVTGRVLGTQWSMGDGTTFSNTPVVYHTYASSGVFKVEFSAWNDLFSAVETSTVTIYPGYTNYVSADGSAAWPYTNWATASTTLQEAVRANIPGGTLLVSNGIYQSDYDISPGGLKCRLIITNDISVIGVNGPGQTIIQGDGGFGSNAVRGVYLNGNASLTGFMVTNGYTRTNEMLSAEALCGGGIWCSGGQAVSNCVITGCHAWQHGGGVYRGSLYHCSLIGNAAEVDGGGGLGAVLNGCIVSDNTAAWYGGGICSGVLARCHVTDNRSVLYGGGIYGGYAENALICSNQANWGGGAAHADLFFDTMVYNTADEMAGGIYYCMASNSIIYFNTAIDAWPNFLNSICLYCCTTPDPQTPGSFAADPQFRMASSFPFMLTAASPCMDAGLTNVLAIDLVGTPRPLDGNGDGHAGFDLGAYEYSLYRYAAPGGGNVWPYSTWADAAHVIQDAVDTAIEGTIVLVSNGVYGSGGMIAFGGMTNRIAIDKAIRVSSVNGPADTVIQGAGPLGDSAVRCAYVGSNAVLCGFMLTNGYTRISGDYQKEQTGGGIWCEPGGVVSNCLVTGNAAQSGGGVHDGLLRNCMLIGNVATEYGGGSYSGVLEHCTVVDNRSDGDGGGIYRSTVLNCIIYSNTALGMGENCRDGDVSYTCTTPDPGGSGNITNDPEFSDYTARDFSLATNSLCIDAGTSNAVVIDYKGVGRPLDGLNDGHSKWDMGAYEFINVLADSDGDGLADTNEIDSVGTNPSQADTDGDGQHDGAEIIAGTDPLSVTSYFSVISWDAVDALEQAMMWQSVTGRLYTVLETPSLTNDWTNVMDYVDRPGTGENMTYTNISLSSEKYYSLRLRLAP